MLFPFYRVIAVVHCITLCVASSCVFAAESESTASKTPPYQPLFASARNDITLPTTADQTIHLASDPTVKYTVACFLGVECPLAKLYGPRLQRLADEFSEQGFQFVGINSNIQDSMEELREYGQQHEIAFPLTKDYDRNVALAFGATRTPEIFIIDNEGKIRYQGRVDDQYKPGVTRQKATQHDLRDAIEDLASGRSVRQPKTTAVGCLIALPRKATTESNITYCDQVVRVLRRNCTECHRKGEIGPFALQDYDEVIGWADMSLEVIEQDRMPPWHAESSHGVFANARNMTEADKKVLREWVDAGLPYGDAANLPSAEEHAEGWRLPQPPDMVLTLFGKEPAEEEAAVFKRHVSVPAQGTVEYQYFVVDPGFTEDTWVRGAQVLPGNAAVVHHCIVFIRPPDGSDFPDLGFLTAYVPGQVRGLYPDGYAQKAPAGSKLVFQMHYTPTGKPEDDRTRVGLLLAEDKNVSHEITVHLGINHNFEIAPGEEETVAGSIDGYSRNGELLLITPHMHLRGKSYKFFLEYEERVETLLSVPSYDFNWQHNYELLKPIPLRDVKELRFEAVFDNSSENPFNPNPEEYVYWGDQTWQEMAVTFIAVAEPRQSKAKKEAKVASTPKRADSPDEKALQERLAELDVQAVSFADRYFSRFDNNGDGIITDREMPNSVRVSGRWSLDQDGDGQLTHEEIKSQWLNRAYRKENN